MWLWITIFEGADTLRNLQSIHGIQPSHSYDVHFFNSKIVFIALEAPTTAVRNISLLDFRRRSCLSSFRPLLFLPLLLFFLLLHYFYSFLASHFFPVGIAPFLRFFYLFWQRASPDNIKTTKSLDTKTIENKSRKLGLPSRIKISGYLHCFSSYAHVNSNYTIISIDMCKASGRRNLFLYQSSGLLFFSPSL